MQQQFATFALIIWVPITIGLFTGMPARKAAVVSLVGAWLILPPLTIPIPGFPNYSKVTATTLGVLLGTILFELPRLVALRPRWFDLPIIVWCLCPFAASMSNGDGVYDGVSQSLIWIFLWALPYLIGRLYFGDLEGLRELATGIIAGGVAYIVPCLWEIKMSPQLLRYVYGMGGWGGMRLGGYRPRVFLSNGLELGTWMCAASLAAWWVWRSGWLKQMAGLPFGKVLLPSLLVTNILCKSSGALVLFMGGVVTLWGSVRFKTKALLLSIILLTPTYYAVRITRLWSGEGLLDFVSVFDEQRSWSLDFRLRNENLMIERALMQPVFGWGGYGRALDVDLEKLRAANLLRKAVPDGLWMIALGNNGVVGLVALTLVILLPPTLFLRRFSPEEWLDPLVAPAAMFAVLLSLYMIDCLLNAQINLIYVVAMGGLIATIPSRDRFPIDQPFLESANTFDSLSNSQELVLSAGTEISSRRLPEENLANRYVELSRSLAAQGRHQEARSIWFRALDLLSRLTSNHPENPRLLSAWCDCCNNLAWFLINQPDADAQDIAQATSLALKATESAPDHADYWNTFGAACYRAGDDQSAAEALHRSLLLQGDRGNAFDYLYLSLICSRLEQHDVARSWYDQGMIWIADHAINDIPLQRLANEAQESLSHFERSEAGI